MRNIVTPAVLSIVITSLLSLRFAAAEPSLEEQKAKMLSHLDERIAALTSAKSCVQVASDREALRACHDKLREERQEKREAFRKELREKMRERREKQDE